MFEWLKIALGALFYEILNKTCNINSELKAILAIIVAKFNTILKKYKYFARTLPQMLITCIGMWVGFNYAKY